MDSSPARGRFSRRGWCSLPGTAVRRPRRTPLRRRMRVTSNRRRPATGRRTTAIPQPRRTRCSSFSIRRLSSRAIRRLPPNRWPMARRWLTSDGRSTGPSRSNGLREPDGDDSRSGHRPRVPLQLRSPPRHQPGRRLRRADRAGSGRRCGPHALHRRHRSTPIRSSRTSTKRSRSISSPESTSFTARSRRRSPRTRPATAVRRTRRLRTGGSKLRRAHRRVRGVVAPLLADLGKSRCSVSDWPLQSSSGDADGDTPLLKRAPDSIDQLRDGGAIPVERVVARCVVLDVDRADRRDDAVVPELVREIELADRRVGLRVVLLGSRSSASHTGESSCGVSPVEEQSQA